LIRGHAGSEHFTHRLVESRTGNFGAQALSDVHIGEKERPVTPQLFDASREIFNAELCHASSLW